VSATGDVLEVVGSLLERREDGLDRFHVADAVGRRERGERVADVRGKSSRVLISFAWARASTSSPRTRCASAAA
jgi:hypothetical protein